MKNIFLFFTTILLLYSFSYVKNLQENNRFLRDEISILESEIWEKDSLINILQKDNSELKEKLKRKTNIKKPKKIKKITRSVEIVEMVPVQEIPQIITDSTKTN